MSSFLQLVLLIVILLAAAKVAGYLTTLIGQPAVLGELLIGLILGPSVIDILHISIFSDHVLAETVEHFAEIGVLFLMFVAGLELHLEELARNSKVSAYAGILGVVLPIALGYGVGLGFGFEPGPAVFLGLTLGATSVSISAQTLMELRVLRSRVGLGLLGAAVFDDVMVILLLSAFIALTSGAGSIASIGLILVQMIIFLVLSFAFGLWILPRLSRKISVLPISQGVLSFAIVILLIYALAAEVVGNMAAITGTFLAGLMFARSPEKERIERGMSSLSYGLFVPIFFVNIGLSVNARQLDVNVFLLMIGITIVAILGKWVGSGIGARLASFSWRESVQLGAGMVSRGEVGLIIASVGISEGLVNESEFSAIVGMVLISTLVTPPTLRALFTKKEAGASSNLIQTPEEIK